MALILPLYRALLASPAMAAPVEASALENLQAQYFGMVSEVDAQLGRVWDALSGSAASGTRPSSWSPPTTESSSATTD